MPQPPPPTPIQALTRRVKELEDDVRMLKCMLQPTRVRRSLPDWLNERYPTTQTPTDRIRTWADRGNLVTVLAKRGFAKATMALWTQAFNPDDDECPIRSFNVAPLIMYKAGPDGWARMEPPDMKALRQATEQWFLGAIAAEHADGSDTEARLNDKVFNASTDTRKLRTELNNYVRRRIKEVKVIEFNP